MSKQARHGHMDIYKALKVAHEDNKYDNSGLECVLFVYWHLVHFGKTYREQDLASSIKQKSRHGTTS
jgi:hypothetical protein